MKAWLLAGLLAFAAYGAAADDIRFPPAFTPALMVHVPRGWTSEKAQVLLSDNLLINSPDSQIVFSISLAPTLGSVDRLAAKILKQAPTGKMKTKLAGLDAFAYRGKTTNPDGVALNLTLIVAPIDPQEAFTCTLITWMEDGDKRLAPARKLIADIKLIRK